MRLWFVHVRSQQTKIIPIHSFHSDISFRFHNVLSLILQWCPGANSHLEFTVISSGWVGVKSSWVHLLTAQSYAGNLRLWSHILESPWYERVATRWRHGNIASSHHNIPINLQCAFTPEYHGITQQALPQ